MQRPIIPAVVSQHVEDAAHLRAARAVLVRAPEPPLQCAAARAAVMLGDRGAAWAALRHLALRPGPFQERALALALLSADPDASRALGARAVRRGGSQRRRFAAAQLQCLAEPGRVRFNCAAPARRQRGASSVGSPALPELAALQGEPRA